MDKCDICATTDSNFWSRFAECSHQKRNWEQEFTTKKGTKKDDNDNFKFCEKCGNEFKNYYADKVVKELGQKSLVDLEKQWFNTTNFTDEGQEKVQRAITKNIKQHKKEWQIKEMDWNKDGQYYWKDRDFLNENGRKRIKSKTILLHQSAKVEYSSNGFLVMDWPKMYWKKSYTSEQWTEIEKTLNQEEQRKQNEKPQTKDILIILGAITLIIGIIILLVYLTRRKRVKSKN